MTDIATTQEGLRALTAREHAAVYIPLLTMRCPDFDFTDIEDFDEAEPGILRFAANEDDVLSNGKTYWRWGFDYQRAAQGLSGNEAQLRMDNVDRRITQAIKLLPSDTAIICEVDIVLSTDPDVVERDSVPFKMMVIDFNEIDITATIGVNDDSRQTLCAFAYGRAVTPALHA